MIPASLLGLLPLIPAISQTLPPLVSAILSAGLSYGAVFLLNVRFLPYVSVTHAAAFKALQEDYVCEE